jgi:hypothetical protein
MTETQVKTVVGVEPDSVSMNTCGGNTPGGAWQCKKYLYGNYSATLLIHFHQFDDGTWHVNDWTYNK